MKYAISLFANDMDDKSHNGTRINVPYCYTVTAFVTLFAVYSECILQLFFFHKNIWGLNKVHVKAISLQLQYVKLTFIRPRRFIF